MTDSTTPSDEGQTNIETQPDEDQEVTLEDLQKQVATLTAQSTKYQKQRQKLELELNTLKKKASEAEQDDYKKLYVAQQEEHSKLLSKVKRSAVESSLRTRLVQAKVIPEAVDIGIKLVDADKISWDIDTGVDELSVETQVKLLKQTHGKLLFERVVPATDTKTPANGSGTNKTMTRAAFENLHPMEKMGVAKTHQIVD